MRKLLTSVVVAVLMVLFWIGQAQAASWYALGVPEMAAHGGATHMAVFTHEDLTKTNTNTAQYFTNSIAARKGLECVALLLDTAFTVGTTNYTDSCLLKIGDGSDDDLFLTSTELASDGTEVFVKFGPPNAYTATSTPTFTTKSYATNVATTTGTFATNVATTTGTFMTNVTLSTTSLVYLNASSNAVTQLVVTAVTPQTSTALKTATAQTSTALKTATAQTATGVSGGSIATTTTAGELGRKVYSAAGNLVFTFTPDANQSVSQFTAGQVRVYFRMFEFGR
jgi:hypothetical protein